MEYHPSDGPCIPETVRYEGIRNHQISKDLYRAVLKLSSTISVRILGVDLRTYLKVEASHRKL